MTEPQQPVDPDAMLDDLAAGIAAKDRAVFDALLTAMLRAGRKAWIEGGDAALVDAAKKSPDRYWQGVTLAAKLAGYSERHELTSPPAGLLGFVREIQGLSEADLERRLRELDPKLPGRSLKSGARNAPTAT